MSFVNPNHPKTQSAIDLALELAGDLLPINDAQHEAQTAMYRACETGQLYDVIEATNRARKHGTQIWRKWQSAWLRAVERQIFEDMEKKRKAAA